MEVRLITEADLDSFMECAKVFFNESRNRKYPADTEKFKNTVALAMKYPDLVKVIVAVDAGKVIAYCVLNTFADYTQQPLGDQYQFYVLPEYRGTGVAREIADATVKQFDDWGCPLSHVSADTGIDDEETHTVKVGKTTMLFINLWQRQGYKVSGIIMTREKIGG